MIRALTIAILIAIASPAFAEEPAAPAPQVPPADGIYYIAVTQADLALIAQAANELPKKIADPFLIKIDTQLRDQAKVITAVKAKP